MKLFGKKSRYPVNTESATETIANVTEPAKQSTNQISSKWNGLASRDKLALLVLLVFLFGFGGIYGGFVLYKESNKWQTQLDNKVSALFWLQAQQHNLKPANQDSSATGQVSASAMAQVQQTIQQAGVQNPNVAQSNDALQISFSNKNQAVIDGVINQLQQQGRKLLQLKIMQNDVTNDFSVEMIVQ